MLTNGIANFPSSQILYLITGYYISTSSLLFTPTIIVGTVGNTIGNIITFLLIKKYGTSLAHKILMTNEKTFNQIHSALHETFTHRGIWWLFVGKLTPSVKAFIPVVAGLANTEVYLTSFIFFSASLVWAIALVYIGLTFGEHTTLSSFMTISFCIGLSILYIVYRNVSKKINK
jgi:membrane protein DedA with SNARE-associated domain